MMKYGRAYSALKAEFGEYKRILRRCINEAKHLYYERTFAIYKNDINKHGQSLKIHYRKNITARRLINLS